jgi:hypothetical protein
VAPRWPFRLPRAWGLDGVTRRRGQMVQRLLHIEGEAAIVRFAQPARDRVVVAGLAERPDLLRSVFLAGAAAGFEGN